MYNEYNSSRYLISTIINIFPPAHLYLASRVAVHILSPINLYFANRVAVHILIIADIKYLLLLYLLYTYFIIFSRVFLNFWSINKKTFQPDHLYTTISVSGKHYICPPTHLFVASRFASNICSPVHLYFANRVTNNI